MNDERWFEDAACIGEPLRTFFPPNVTGANSLWCYSRARRICATCPVKPECLAFAMRCEGAVCASGRASMFGGLAPWERYRLYRARLRGLTVVV